MSGLAYLVFSILIVGLFLYGKLLPHKDKLSEPYLKIFNFFDMFYTPLFELFRKIAKPRTVGQGLMVDMSQIWILIIFLLFMGLF